MAKKPSETPLMKQHREIKSKYPDAILLFRVGDFYETFDDDAVIAAKILGITLTRRSNGSAGDTPLAGFPHHSLETYLHKLVKAGHRVAVCDQLEDPKTVKGIVKRGVTELVTPGVATSDKLLDNTTNNFLAALHLEEKMCGLALIDISTGECLVAQGDTDYMDKLLQSFRPAEVLVSKNRLKLFKEKLDQKYYTFCLEDWVFRFDFGYENLIRHFNTQSLKGFGIEDWEAAVTAAGAALHYLKDTEHPNLQHLTGIERITATDFVWMDRFTIRNLELLHSPEEKGHTLLGTLDQTCTAMGGRLMKRWLIFPLNDLERIAERQEWVHQFLCHTELREDIYKHLKQIGDIERLVAKIPLKKVNPREVLQLAQSLRQADEVRQLLLAHEALFAELGRAIPEADAVRQRISRTLSDDPPAALSKGKVIREGFHAELDELRNIAYKGKEFLLKIQQSESERTGIPSLKVGFNNVFGYYLEVTHTHKDKVPPEWIRKQTLTSAERYITPELKSYEEKILGTEEKIALIESRLFTELLEELQPAIADVQQTAQAIARIDCLLSFTQLAAGRQYCRPELHEGYELEIKNGRHPVIEQRLPPGERYIANDLYLDRHKQQIIILTGPNMSGKSALLRQAAIITLMAHMGAYVPADQARIPLTDKIFTRVGASDNLSGGESTFMVEMNETASIINNLSARSLILLDEIGRGTSTYDGISIAWSIVEYLQESERKPKTLFATHYHELNELENRLPGVRNYHITHKETGNKVVFLRKLAPGGSRHSFGIQVARMAGMPPELTRRAEAILSILEEKNAGNDAGAQLRKIPTQTFQLNLFEGLAEDLSKVKEQLFSVDINSLTPVEALMKLNELKEIVRHYQAANN